jgi:hypothetical protein
MRPVTEKACMAETYHYELYLSGHVIPVSSEERLESLAGITVPELRFGSLVVRTDAILAFRQVDRIPSTARYKV